MTIFTAPAPLEATRVAHDAFVALCRARVLPPGVRATIHRPLAVYRLLGDALSDGVSITDARPVGWRYLIGHGDTIRSVELAENRATAIANHRVATNLVDALVFASASIDAAARYEARVLEFGRAMGSLLWLHGDGAPDRFISMGARPREVDGRDALARAGSKAHVRRRLTRDAAHRRSGPDAHRDRAGG